MSSPDRSVTSCTSVQKQVGQTIVQLVQARQRLATSSHIGLSALAYSSSLRPTGVQGAAHPPGRALGDRVRRRSQSSAGAVSAPIRSSTSAPRSEPTSTTNRCPPSSSISVSDRS